VNRQGFISIAVNREIIDSHQAGSQTHTYLCHGQRERDILIPEYRVVHQSPRGVGGLEKDGLASLDIDIMQCLSGDGIVILDGDHLGRSDKPLQWIAIQRGTIPQDMRRRVDMSSRMGAHG